MKPDRSESSAGTVVVALVVTAVAVAALGTPMLLLVAAGYVGVYLALGAPEPLLDTLTHRAATARERATVMSVQSLGLRICGSAGALAAGMLAANTSAAYVWALVVAVLAVGALVAAGLSSGDRAAGEASATTEAHHGLVLEHV
ncbi:hypothetical protein GCM10011610_04720 [Nocardia rhizosphaerihabitans]|uniref:Major facilitator superfamily (MFS) profile domain-containing protein n=1 Tax=Nocardia rhizosphaerihabitans TaxID=1691570 RepID=A0ABQ2K3S1_9NOCA|nr:hypothetical protein GCM10011610_04720 [Nocardia rhizosphaerihabitans]